MLWNGSECEKDQGIENLKAAIPITDYDRSKTTGECGIFKLFQEYDNKQCVMDICHCLQLLSPPIIAQMLPLPVCFRVTKPLHLYPSFQTSSSSVFSSIVTPQNLLCSFKFIITICLCHCFILIYRTCDYCLSFIIFRRVCKISKSNYQLCHVHPSCLSVRPHGATQFPLDRY